jgi:ribosomal protein S18 acetylase RimI-like enzyme
MLTIRPYQPEDAAGVERCFIELQEFERTLEPNRVECQLMAAPYRESLLAWCAQATGVLFIAEAKGTVVGLVAVIAQVNDESLIEIDQDYAYIADLVVLPAYRGQGLGRALLQQAEVYAINQGAKCLKVDVLAANRGARNLYQAVGFQENEIRLVKSLIQTSLDREG